jgi:hypothetical protein
MSDFNLNNCNLNYFKGFDNFYEFFILNIFLLRGHKNERISYNKDSKFYYPIKFNNCHGTTFLLFWSWNAIAFNSFHTIISFP